jgi:hypothetical protein
MTSLLAVVLLALAVLYMTQFSAGTASPALRWTIVALAASIIAIRLIARRSRR